MADTLLKYLVYSIKIAVAGLLLSVRLLCKNDWGLFLAALIADRAGCLACRLAGCLAFAAAALGQALFQIALVQGFNMLHNTTSSPQTKFTLL
jgi:hypothetical protein